jgi:hypothetical protein
VIDPHETHRLKSRGVGNGNDWWVESWTFSGSDDISGGEGGWNCSGGSVCAQVTWPVMGGRGLGSISVKWCG